MTLGLGTLGAVPVAARPPYDPRQVGIGMVHLGAGAFFRAHVASYADQVIAAGNDRWGVLAVSQRSPVISDALASQDGLYTMIECADDLSARVLGAVRGSLCAATDPAAVAGALADPRVRLVTLTVTEQGYPATRDRALRIDAGIVAEIGGAPPRSVVGQLVRGLELRMAAGAGPVSVVSCDNLLDNGGLLRGLVTDFADRLDDPWLRDWIERFVSFPPTVVDRIVPATTDADRTEAGRLIGLRDEIPVVAEPFRQWVVGGALPDKPVWEEAGVTFTHDVGLYEQLKLRLLNATHCLVAYLGALAGYETIAAAVRDPTIEAVARRFAEVDQLPTVAAPDGVDLRAYVDEVFRRFANPMLRHTTAQVGTDGSKKLPERLVPAVRESRAAGRLPVTAALVLAAWIRVLGGQSDDGRPTGADDPLAARLRPVVGGPAADVVRTVFAEAFGPDLAEDSELVGVVARWYDELRAHGVAATLRRDAVS